MSQSDKKTKERLELLFGEHGKECILNPIQSIMNINSVKKGKYIS